MSNRGRHYYIIISVNTNGYNSELKQTSQAVPLKLLLRCVEKHFKCIVSQASADTRWS